MRRPTFVLAAALLVAACSGPAAGDTRPAGDTTGTTSTTTEPPIRSITVVGVADDAATTGEPAPSEVSRGDEVATGDTTAVVLVTDDATTIVVLPSSRLVVADLGWDGAHPVTRLSLLHGRVAALREQPLADGAVFEIGTDSFTAGLTGSALVVTRPDDGTAAGASCLFGGCFAGDATLMGNERIDLSDGEVSTVAMMTASDRRLWAEVLAALRATGTGVDTCACNGRSLQCEGAVEVPYFPACPDDTTCACTGPDLVCEDGREFPDDQQCMADMTPLSALLVPDFFATYGCIDARTRYKVFDPTLSLEEAVLTPYEEEAESCEAILPGYPVTYAVPGPDAGGELTGSASFASGTEYDFAVVEGPGEGMQGSLGPRYGDSFTVYGRSSSGGRGTTTISGEDTDAVMTRSGSATVTVAGATVAAWVYEGSFTGWERWESDTGVGSTLEYAGTIRVWLDVATGLELRREVEATYTGCSNCAGFIGLRERLEITELIDTNQPLG